MSDLGTIQSGADYTWQVDVTVADGITGSSVTKAIVELTAPDGTAAIEKNSTDDPTEVFISDNTLSAKFSDTETAALAGKYFISAKLLRSDGLYGFIPQDRIYFNADNPLKSAT